MWRKREITGHLPSRGLSPGADSCRAQSGAAEKREDASAAEKRMQNRSYRPQCGRTVQSAGRLHAAGAAGKRHHTASGAGSAGHGCRIRRRLPRVRRRGTPYSGSSDLSEGLRCVRSRSRRHVQPVRGLHVPGKRGARRTEPGDHGLRRECGLRRAASSRRAAGAAEGVA